MMRWRVVLACTLPAGLLLAVAARLMPGVVEAVYARGLYRAIAAAFAFLTGWIPFSVAEPLLVIAVAWSFWRGVRFVRAMAKREEPRATVLKRGALTCVGAVGVVYLSFLLLWGLNYHRRPLATLLNLEVRDVTPSELAKLSDELVAEANALRATLPEDAAGVLAVADAKADAREAYAALARHQPLVAGVYGRPKPALLSPVMARFGVTGIYCPFTGEPHVNTTDVKPTAVATICHEMAHQRGFAAENEAEFVSLLACRASASPSTRYSGVLAAIIHIRNANANAVQGISEPVQRDIDAIHGWVRRYYHPVASVVGAKVNDVYLQANAQAEGVRSYGRVVDLLLAERRARVASR